MSNSFTLVNHEFGYPPGDINRGDFVPSSLLAGHIKFHCTDGAKVCQDIRAAAREIVAKVVASADSQREAIFAEAKRLDEAAAKARAELSSAEHRIAAETKALHDALKAGVDPEDAELALAEAESQRQSSQRRHSILRDQASAAYPAAHAKFEEVEKQTRLEAIADLQRQLEPLYDALSKHIETHYPEMSVLSTAMVYLKR